MNPNAKASDPVASTVSSRGVVNNTIDPIAVKNTQGDLMATDTDMMACSDGATSFVSSDPVDDSSSVADHGVIDEANVEEFQESRLRSSVFGCLYHVYAYSPNAHFCSGAFRKNFKVP